MAQRKAQAVEPPPMDVVLGVNVRHDREAAGMSQSHLGVYSGTSKNTVGLIEGPARVRGRENSTTTDTIKALARTLGTSWLRLVTVRPELMSEYHEATRVYLQGEPPTFEVITGAGRTSPQQPPLMAAVSP